MYNVWYQTIFYLLLGGKFGKREKVERTLKIEGGEGIHKKKKREETKNEPHNRDAEGSEWQS
jgi:hypothetical protein